MARHPRRPVALRGEVFRGSQQIAQGRITRGELRGPAWRRLFPDVYACSTLPVTHRLRARAVGGLLLPHAVVSGRSAAVLWGAELATADDDIECTIEPSRRSGAVRGVRVTRRALSNEEVDRREGVLVTSPIRTALDLGRVEPPDEAVVCVDAFLRLRLVTLEEVRTAAGFTTGPGCRGIRLAVARADGRAESPRETRLRLLLHASRLPRPVAQHVVLDVDGRFVARVDFAWPVLRVALEYDGAWHGAPQQVGKDRRRLNALTAAGWTVVFVTAVDLADPVLLLARIGAALETARMRPVAVNRAR